MAVGATRPAIRHRESCGYRRHCGRRGGRAFTTRRLHAPRLRFARRNQRDTQRQAQFRFSPRYRAGRGYRPWPACPGGAPIVPGKTIPEFIAHAKANSGKVHSRSACIGTMAHIAPGLFKVMAEIDMVHVPYRGVAPALTDLIGGQVQVNFSTMSSSIEYIRAGKVRALAVTTATRSPVLPDIPTVAEFVPDYESSFCTGVPAEIIDKFNREINAALADPQFKARLADLGGTALSGSPAEFGRFIASETEKWAKVVKFAGVKAD